MSDLFSFQGKIYLGERSAQGKLVKSIWVGNAPACSVQFQTETTNKTESFSGNRLPYGRLRRGKTANITLSLDEWILENLILGLHGKSVPVTAGSATGEVLPTGIVAGDLVRLDKGFVSSVVITDSAGTPAPVPHTVESPNAGLIRLGSLTGVTPPFSAAYSYAAAQSLSIFAETPPERWLYLDGINTENNRPVLLDLYRVSFDPVGDLGLIHDEYGQLSMTGSVLYDPANANGSNMHGFGNVQWQDQ
ncbi:hypothetical protein [Ectopseudomonas oleovorans]|uniref:phage tail tube protein n=1 Tax=Ectopseudomonas oleovorans TaxID=301 RepID=UPI002449DCE1|nr:hypothetical protein [Pseudomonas oleovorans]MDH2197881.1 hypothetical protein [Pseudomonas oleovorans]